MSELTVDYRSIDELIPYARNARTHSDQQVAQIAASIKEFGFLNPIICDGDSRIIAGHGRVMAAQKLGLERVPTILVDHLTDAQRKAYILADNKLAENAGWDTNLLSIELKELEELNFDLNLIGFDGKELDRLLEPEVTEGLTGDDDIPGGVETRCKPGDIWQLGNHRVMCGDSTNVQHVDALLDGNRTDITFTSPPYNMGKNAKLGGSDSKYKNHDDNMSDNDYLALLDGFTNLAVETSRYVFVNLQMLTNNRKVLLDYQSNHAAELKDILVWNKKQCPPNIVKGAFNTKWEYVFCFSKDAKSRGFPEPWQGKYPNVIETESNAENEFAKDHKAGFPVAFPIWMLEKLSFAKYVYEPFCGTGTTLIACEKTNRKCYGMEIDPHYCDVIITRWENFTGKKAELI